MRGFCHFSAYFFIFLFNQTNAALLPTPGVIVRVFVGVCVGFAALDDDSFAADATPSFCVKTVLKGELKTH